MVNNTDQWYALYTKPKAEYKVATFLEQLGFEIFLPELHRRKKDKIEKKPFFPCYLFMAANLAKVDSSAWKWTPGLRYMVTNGSQPIHLPPEVIQLIKAKLEKINIKAQNASTAYADAFEPGDSVRITNGPLQDMVAIFEGPTNPGNRVRVLLTVLDYQRRIQLNVTELEKVTGPIQGSRRRHTRGRGRVIKH